MEPKLTETIYLDFITSDTTGATADADELPTYEVFENATDTALTVSGGTLAKRTDKTGNYRITLPVTAANGFEVDKTYNVVASAVIDELEVKAVVGTFQVRDFVAAVGIVVVEAIEGTFPQVDYPTSGGITFRTEYPARGKINTITWTSGKVWRYDYDLSSNWIGVTDITP